MPNIDAKAAIGEKMAPETPGSIQIWAALPPIFDNQDNMLVEGRMSCEVVLCTQGGPVVDLKWMPMGAWDNVSRLSLGLGNS
jgi:transcription factor C subunit 6